MFNSYRILLLLAAFLSTLSLGSSDTLATETQEVEPQSVSTADLIGLWHLDGDASDASGSGHDGVISGATAIPDGISGKAFRFDGNDGIDVGNLDFSGGKYTVNVWLRTTRPAVTEDWRDAINKADIYTGDQTFEIDIGDGRLNDNAPRYLVWNGGVSVVYLNSNINARDGNWHMVTVTYANGSQKMYVDSFLAGSSNYPGPLPLVSQSVVIGSVDGFGPYHHPWIGDLDEVSIYTRVLDAGEVDQLYRLHQGLPFASFTPRIIMKFGPQSTDDAFEVMSSFTLNANSDGIDPITENVGFQLGAFSITIPSGSFVQDGNRVFRFEGIIDKVKLKVKIMSLGNQQYKFRAEVEGVDLNGTLTPLNTKLTIGNDEGKTNLTTGKAKFSEIMTAPCDVNDDDKC